MQSVHNAIIKPTKNRRSKMRYEAYSSQMLKSVRAEKGLSQQGLADKAGIPLVTLKKLEQGVNEPTAATARALGRALGLHFFFDWREPGEKAGP